MTDFLLSAGVDIDRASVEEELQWTSATKTLSGECGGLSWVISRLDDLALWGPAYDSESKVRVLLAGRVAYDPQEWDLAERLPFEGGLAARMILSRWLERGAAGVEKYNGAAVVIVVEERERRLTLWTDRMGFYPAFRWRSRGFLLCSHPDVAAHVLMTAGAPCGFDPVTMAEFLRTGTATQPHSYWRDIDQLEAGSRYEAAFGGTPRLEAAKTYWRPAYFDGAPAYGRMEFVERFADALKAAVRRRTQARLGVPAVMLSSGADSRVALLGAENPSAVQCYTLYDEINPEVIGAQRLAKAANAQHQLFERDAEYYITNARKTVRVSGGMWSIESGHYTGVLDRLLANGHGVFLTGCYADYLFKGVAQNRRARQLFGRNLPIHTPADYSHEFYLAFTVLSKPWMHETDERLEARFNETVKASARRLELEHRRLAPVSREGDTSGRLTLWRCTPFDMLVADSDILDLYGRLSLVDKISGVAFGMAVARVVGPDGAAVKNNNYSTPVGASEIRRVAAFLRASLMRKMQRLVARGQSSDPRSVATAGSWPNMSRVAALSTGLRDWRASLPKDHEELLFDIVGAHRKAWGIDTWAERDATLLIRLFTAGLWLSEMRPNLAA